MKYNLQQTKYWRTKLEKKYRFKKRKKKDIIEMNSVLWGGAQ
jgi:hypothetical protein